MRDELKEKIRKYKLVFYDDDGDKIYTPLIRFIEDIDDFMQLIDTYMEQALDDYSNKLNKWGYIDSDYYTEEPTTVKRYLDELKKGIK
jgi:hypothetical protein